MEGVSFPRAFERREEFIYLRKFLSNWRDMLNVPCKRAALSIWALLGYLKWVRLLGLLRERENEYLGSFSWTQRTFWNFSKEQGCPELISDCGAQRSRLLGLGASGPWGLIWLECRVSKDTGKFVRSLVIRMPKIRINDVYVLVTCLGYSVQRRCRVGADTKIYISFDTNCQQ